MKQQQIDQLLTEFDRQLCRRDYELLAEHHQELLDALENLVNGGADDVAIKRVVYQRLPGDNLLVQRIKNATLFIRAR